jgi:hypothetical protein
MRRKKYRMVVVVVWELGNSVQQMQLLASNVMRERQTDNRQTDSRRSSRNLKTHPLRQTLGMALPLKKKSL